jgi:hypothetical protein
VASVGVRPTVATEPVPVLEVFIFDFDAPLYGRRIGVEFVHKVRDEERYPDLATLTRQIADDVAQARDYFDTAGNTAYRSANTNITGVVEVRGDRICEKFDGYFLDRMVCGYVYRNTSGEQGDRQYIHVTPRALTFFSPVP